MLLILGNRAKIKSIRTTLAAEKRKYGTYDDNRGLPSQPDIPTHPKKISKVVQNPAA
ncbi:hypothetical protein [Haliscomenobacter sp.]|uniref:hypothetical protein n=1 Tax=Haliscomenobacter sp. TaxID=2717303 RepID=UPI003364E25E